MSEKNRTPLIVGGLVVLVIVAAALAVFLTGGDDDSDANSEPVASLSEGDLEVLPVTVTGELLEPHNPDVEEDAAVGVAAPVVEGHDYWTTPTSIGGASDNPTMVVFLAHWCPHCNDEIPVLIGLDEDGLLPENLDVVGVSTAVRADGENYPPSQWLDFKDWPWPVLADNERNDAVMAYGGGGFPFTVILDEDGNVLARKSGSSSADELMAWIEETLA